MKHPLSQVHNSLYAGRLPFAWPATADARGPTLFPVGHGLSHAAGGTVPRLPEDPGVEDAAASGVFMSRGLPAAGWSLEAVDDGGTTRVTALPLSTAGGQITVTATDHGVQEGARRFAIAGDRPSAIQLSTQAPVDLTRETNGDLQLVVAIRVDAPPTSSVNLTMRSGDTRAEVPLGRLEQLPAGRWTTFGVPLKCFEAAGGDMSAVDVPFALNAQGAMTISLADVQLQPSADTSLPCRR